MTQIDADADAEICPDFAEIQAAVSDRSELDDDTAIDSSDVQGSRQTLSSPASRTPYKVHARCVRIWRPTGVWTTADGGCVHRREGVGLNGARRCAPTPLKRTVFFY